MTDEIEINLNKNEQNFNDFQCSTETEIETQLFERMSTLKKKMEIIKSGYELGCNRISDECSQIKDQIDKTVYLSIIEILNKRQIMFEDIEFYKNETLLNLKQQYENNQNFEKNKNILNETYEKILQEFNEVYSENPGENEKIKKLLTEKIDILSTKVNECCLWVMPNQVVNLVFTKNEPVIRVPFIGDISYDSVYKTDILNKLSCLNNTILQRLIKLDHLVEKCILVKHIALISKNNVLILYEKVFGKVTSVFMKIVYFNGTVLYEREVCNVGSLTNYCVYHRHIVLDFQIGKNQHILHLYDTKLKFIQESSINYKIESILMSNDTILVISNKQPYVHEYDYELNNLRSYGQKSKEKKPFFVKDEIFALTDQKIFVKYQNEMRLLCRFSGELVSKIVIDGLKASKIYLDFNKEKYLVFSELNKLCYYSHKGELIKCNIIKTKENFGEFQYSRSGHFGFIDNKKNLILII
ncbi:hypothetical protein BpHYR1_051363 [Brachionus plicatilis]|uniref:Uncharacterized protein n=1 Tax=Brachionus plicatilis TaxID=10195 RepID=A0A3M7RK13_BRAPC|nr:hypothetical protein BpHYR1_051363 [Brachionus plicatilis]